MAPSSLSPHPHSSFPVRTLTTPPLCPAWPPCLGGLPAGLCWQRPRYCPRLGSASTGSGAGGFPAPSGRLGCSCPSDLSSPCASFVTTVLSCRDCLSRPQACRGGDPGFPSPSPSPSGVPAEGRHWACAEGRMSGWYWTLTSGLRQGDARRCSAKEFGRGRALQKWPQVTLRMSSPRLSRGRTDHVSPGATCSPRVLGARWMAAGSTSREKGAVVPLPQEREARRSPAACPGSRGWPEAGPCPPHVLICECARRQVTPVPGDGGGAHSAPGAA